MVGDKGPCLNRCAEFDPELQARRQTGTAARPRRQAGQLVTGKSVVCSTVGTDQNGRTLGRCMVGART